VAGIIGGDKSRWKIGICLVHLSITESCCRKCEFTGCLDLWLQPLLQFHPQWGRDGHEWRCLGSLPSGTSGEFGNNAASARAWEVSRLLRESWHLIRGYHQFTRERRKFRIGVAFWHLLPLVYHRRSISNAWSPPPLQV
jgi:hypothetical protein